MASVDLGPGECNGGVAVVLRGELEVAGAASAAALVPAGAACRQRPLADCLPGWSSTGGSRTMPPDMRSPAAVSRRRR
jgi:hypothetical protein